MEQSGEPVRDLAHLGHVELLTPRPDESLRFFTEVYGLNEVGRRGQSVHLRGWGDYDLTTLKLTESPEAGLGHMGWRTASPLALERRVAALERGGFAGTWNEGDLGHGAAYRFESPDGHRLEVYYESERYEAPDGERSYLPNQPQRFAGRGAGARRIDHLNVLCREVSPNRRFMQEVLGFREIERILLEGGRQAASWMSVTSQSHDLALTTDRTGSRGRLHHVAYWLDTREDVLRAADLLMENGVPIELGPAKHSRAQSFFLYMIEPGGNRVELTTGGFHVFAPDWEPITWRAGNLGRGTAWGQEVPDSFHTYGTPVVADASATAEETRALDTARS